LFTDIDRQTFFTQAHSDFSPIGWHLGHIAFTESHWILEKCANLPPLFPEYHKLFTADGLPKSERENLPEIETILEYLTIVRKQVLDYLEKAPIEKQTRLWYWLIQHESQHSETITFILQLHRFNNNKYPQLIANKKEAYQLNNEMILIPAGDFLLGNNNLEAIDNESPSNLVYLDNFYLDKYPITCCEYREFMEAGGYQKREYWSTEGWKWLEINPVSHPLYWSDSSDWNNHPVCGVSYYEAEAYSKFIGKRLPTELEWEKAASWHNLTGTKSCYPWGNKEMNSHRCNHNLLVGHTTPVDNYSEGKSAFGCYDMLGNVWEWTSSWFSGYQGFQCYPYPGYSQVYFDNKHRVLKGGSWATRPWSLRNTFRNWYYPWIRQILVGFRCASD
jgi:ergothioneine biosynthesis protein EgtB